MRRHACLAEIAQINPPIIRADEYREDSLVPFLPMSAVSEGGTASYDDRRFLADVAKGYTPFGRGDVLIAKITPCFENGKAVFLNDLPAPIGFGSTEFHVLRPGPDVDGRYLFHAVWTDAFRRSGSLRMTGSAGQKRVPVSFLRSYMIPLPSLMEQGRIADVFDKADAVRRKRQESVRLIDDFAPSAFIEIFGDPGQNSKGWKLVQLGDLVEFRGGGTPSRARREFFAGNIPWASSKDIIDEDLFGTQEFVTHEAVAQSATQIVPAGTILVVVKSKILMRRLPVAIARVPTCFSQDIKGLVLRDPDIPVSYLARHLRIGQGALLAKARGANTEGLTLEHLRGTRIMVPPGELLEKWEEVERRCGKLRAAAKAHLAQSHSLFQSLAQRVFSIPN